MRQPYLKTRRHGLVHPNADIPDLQTQLESLFDVVWREERFERRHPFYCATIRGLVERQ